MTGDLREAIVAEARSWLGTPYRHQGSRKGVGCDCLGLIRGVWRVVYGREPELPGPYAADWAETGEGDRLMAAAHRHCCVSNEAQSGDLLVFRWRPDLPARHLGILSGDAQFIHAYQSSEVVETALVKQWRNRIAGVFQFPPIQTTD